MRADFFDRLPPPTALLLLSALMDLTAAQMIPLPRRTPPPTTTLPHHALNVVPFPPPAGTPAPRYPFNLLRRQDELNTICGFIGGSSELPATCGAGSHCVLDIENNVVGCCPNGQATCTDGIYTGCVDANSGPQSVVNPYVYTCQGSNVCYQNFFEGGMSMFGCGTASELGTTVMATATGITTSLTRPTTRVSIKSVIKSTHSRSTSSSTTSSTTSTTSSRPTSSQSLTSSTQPATSPSSSSTVPPVAVGSDDRLGPIIGGSLGGAAVLLALLAFAVFFFRRRRNSRSGPGPMSVSPPKSSTGSGFEPLHQSSEAFETGLPPPVAAMPAFGHPGGPGGTQPVFSNDLSAGGPSPFAYYGATAPHASYPPAGQGHPAHASYPPAQGYHYPGQFPAAYAGAAIPVVMTGAAAGVAHARNAPHMQMGAAGSTDSDRAPLTAYTDAVPGQQSQPHALDRIGEEDEDDRERTGSAPSSGEISDSTGQTGSGGAGGGSNTSPTDNRPLWQQNRRQSRNQVWM